MSDDQPPRSRKRMLSREEKELWREVAKSAKPLRRKRALVDAEIVVADEARPSPDRVAKKIAREIAAAPVVKSVQQPLVSLDRRERSRIARGRKQIDARIDLHGMTQARAHRSLIAFLHRAHGEGAALVLVITGKGQPAASGEARGVLRRQLPLWLSLPELRSLVLGFDAAHAAHGGDGAFYIRLRRFRDD
ncbi:MAG: Smr/MutS family protein [Xanthobacteraceae bacterium]